MLGSKVVSDRLFDVIGNAIAASLTPYMQKRNIWGINTHIAINISLLTLFDWQVVTGLGIVLQILNPA
jgi:hypothetical protein